MSLGVPRWFIATLAIVFSVYHIVLAVYSLDYPRRVEPIFAALALYALATAVSLLPWGGFRLPIAVASFDLAVVVVLPLLVSNELDPDRVGGNGYAIWYAPAIGTLLAIVSTRHRHSFAWIGVSYLAVHTFAWGGVDALLTTGVIGAVSWVAVSHILAAGMAKATRDSNRFALAEREASDWQAARLAHVFERQHRLGHTSDVALPLLQRIVATGGRLSPEEQAECLLVESAIRDEIRGRNLLSDDVRAAVSAARRRGASVTLLDEGELDGVGEKALVAVHARIAAEIAATDAQTITVRSSGGEGDLVVTIVGVGASDGMASDAGPDSGGAVVLWAEIPVGARVAQ